MEVTIMRIEPISSINPTVSTGAAGKLPAENAEASSLNRNQDSVPSNTEAKDLEQALLKVKERFEKVNVGFEYSIDETTKRKVVKIIDKDTKEVIRQYPPEEILNMLQKMYEMLGIFIDQKL